MKAFLVMCLVVLAGCTSAVKPDANYQLQLEMVQKFHASEIEAREKMANMQAIMISACNGDASCVREIALNNTLQALAVRGGGNGSNAPTIPSFQRRESFWEKAGLTVLSGLIPGYVSVRQSDNATRTNIAQIDATAQSTNALYGMLDNFVGNVQPNITITGRDGAGIGNSYSYTSADGNTTTTGDGNAVGAGSRTDNSRGQINGDGNNNSGRIGSPGPWNWENSNNGGNCPGGNGGDGGGAPGGGSGGAGADGGDCSGGG